MTTTSGAAPKAARAATTTACADSGTATVASAGADHGRQDGVAPQEARHRGQGTPAEVGGAVWTVRHLAQRLMSWSA